MPLSMQAAIDARRSSAGLNASDRPAGSMSRGRDANSARSQCAVAVESSLRCAVTVYSSMANLVGGDGRTRNLLVTHLRCCRAEPDEHLLQRVRMGERSVEPSLSPPPAPVPRDRLEGSSMDG